MRYILNQNQCGFLMKHGCFVKTLYQGTYQYFKALGYEIVVEEMEGLVGFKKAPKEVLLADEAFAGRVLEARVPEGFLGILRENGVVKKVGTEPLTLYWNHWGRYTFELLDMRSPEMDEAMTRSFLNTTKLMDENRTLYKLKELECLERICAQVGNINVAGGGALLEQLKALMGKEESA